MEIEDVALEHQEGNLFDHGALEGAWVLRSADLLVQAHVEGCAGDNVEGEICCYWFQLEESTPGAVGSGFGAENVPEDSNFFYYLREHERDVLC